MTNENKEKAFGDVFGEIFAGPKIVDTRPRVRVGLYSKPLDVNAPYTHQSVPGTNADQPLGAKGVQGDTADQPSFDPKVRAQKGEGDMPTLGAVSAALINESYPMKDEPRVTYRLHETCKWSLKDDARGGMHKYVEVITRYGDSTTKGHMLELPEWNAMALACIMGDNSVLAAFVDKKGEKAALRKSALGHDAVVLGREVALPGLAGKVQLLVKELQKFSALKHVFDKKVVSFHVSMDSGAFTVTDEGGNDCLAELVEALKTTRLL